MSFPTRSVSPFKTSRTNDSSASSSSSTSSSDYEHLNLFHKFDQLKVSPLAGLYNVVAGGKSVGGQAYHHTTPPPPPAPPLINITRPSISEDTPEIEAARADIIVEDMPPTAPEKPSVVITEQPQSKALRFRYECEGRSAGSIPGVNSTPDQKTFPSIEVRGHKGRAVVVVSCVTKDPPYRPHPHNLVGKEGCRKGVCTVEINSSSMGYTFSNLGIQCVKKKDIEEALRLREEIRVDPFKTGYSHAKQPTTIDLNAVRLCFQVFLEGQQRGRFTEPLQPVVSDVIYDKKAMSDLVICKLSDVTASVAGGKEIILLCEKVAKEDIAVRFYEEQHGKILWEGDGEFQHTNVHKQVAISFRTPRYRSIEIDKPVMVNIQLRRPSDGATSVPLPFELVPLDSANISPKRKRQKISSWEVPDTAPEGTRDVYYPNLLNVPGEAIKLEPKDSPTHQFAGFPGSYYRKPSEGMSPNKLSPASLHGSTTPIGPTSPYAGANSLTPTPTTGCYQTSPSADFLLGGQEYQNQYNILTPVTPATTTLPVYHQLQQQLQQSQQQFSQFPTNAVGNTTINLNDLMTLNQPGPSGAVVISSQPSTEATNEYSLNLLDMDFGKEFSINSSDMRSLLGHFSNSDIKQELQNTTMQNATMPNINNQQRVQQEEENLSNSFTNVLTLNDLNR
ncbi:proto-oncogene c-Rel-like isoform X6 [Toxorhynchites rutilus septentrionalis]|uniref:proto-oncogene c-Rel-like isoform X6 n=1 Tax=Toxorhynchites rutilus septentrionalis TaxID=329112 RepID=UPI0024798012|nr:proto-oncogene c-Rel-like isoform X6 [Toxorhynchites rutilus septentrionalis]